jgi:hypothetical protein
MGLQARRQHPGLAHPALRGPVQLRNASARRPWRCASGYRSQWDVRRLAGVGARSIQVFRAGPWSCSTSPTTRRRLRCWR